MKIKNILVLSLSLLVFASCSKDDDGTDGPKEPMDAVISVMATATSQKTKAVGDLKGPEEFIQTLTAYVFDSTGQLAGSGTATSQNGQSVSQIDGILIKITPGSDGVTSAADYKMVLLANTNITSLSIESLNDLQNATGLGKPVESYIVGSSYLPMTSEVLTIKGIKKSEKDAGGNWLTNNWAKKDGGAVVGSSSEADPIALTRMLARVEVNRVAVFLSNNYGGATFNLKTIALMNVRTDASLSRKGIGEYVKGYQSGGYNYNPTDPDSGWWIPVDKNNNTEKGDKTCKVIPELSETYTFRGVDAGSFEFQDPIKTPATANPYFYRYIYPNSKKGSDGALYETGIVVGGEFVFQGGKKLIKHFIVLLRDPKATNFSPEVLPNTVYKVDISIEGEGSEDENHPQKTAMVTATITVDNWKVIGQKEDLGPITPEQN